MGEAYRVCPGGCGKQIPRALVACPQCWARLPAPLRAAVNRTYEARRTSGPASWAHLRALSQALDWYRNEHNR